MRPTKEMEDELLFTAAHIADPERRRAYLDQACGNNAELRASVEELLALQEESEPFLERGRSGFVLAVSEIEAAAIEEGAVQPPAVDTLIGTRIDRYKLLQRIGEGGYGVVYMAEQEAPVRRTVALKIIKLGMDTQNVIARFEVERQALALMEHPNIARVLDAGATEAGRPYFVMELVRGVKITEYCDVNNLDTHQRLKLFIQICHAIQHAHQKGIIHRDIKPSNILVTMHDGVPVPKVIDFGIAKAIEDKLTEQTLFTAYEQLIGTPAYMSPEQAELSGLDVDTRSDIYSLGVLLYELLAGRTPFDGQELLRSGLIEMRRTLQETEPPRPSAMLTTIHGEELLTTAAHRLVEPPRLISTLKGDLDWIVMKSLEKDRTRRYETANGLLMDVERYLANEPVLARPPSRIYRLRKLVHRNRVVFASGAAVVVALIVGLGISTWLFVRESRLRLEAENRERITQAAFLISRGQHQEADQLVSQVTGLKPSLEAEGVLRTLGEWHVGRNEMDLAASRFNQLLQADQGDRSGRITTDLLIAGPIQIERGDLQGYEVFRRAAIARFSDTTDPVDAERTVKISLLLPADETVMKSLEPLARVDEATFERDPKRAGTNPLMAGWRCISLGIKAYRQGFYPTAKEWCRRSLEYKPEIPARTATAHVISAMASHQLGEWNKSRSELELGRKLIESHFAENLKLDNESGGPWYDWLFARVLLREATNLVEK
jgi:eukaryotic-like serine/threonine-protein kinase